MGRSSLLGANPNEAYRKKAQEREAKRNKEVRDKMREVAVLHKDTSKMERKIEQYRKIVRVRKMTAAEKEKLQAMEVELKDVLDKQKAAGIAPKKRDAANQAIGYDPMAAAEAGASRISAADSPSPPDSEDDGGDATMFGRAMPLGQFDELDDMPDSMAAIAHGNADGASKDVDPLPPMPPGTPPLLPQDLGLGQIWPPLPSGPSPLYVHHNPRPSQQDSDNGRGYSQRPPSRAPYRPQQHRHGGNERHGQRAHPYAHPNANTHSRPGITTAPLRPGISQGVPLNQPPPVPPGFPRPPQIHTEPPRPPPRPASSGTVLAAEPQVRNLKKELTTLVPAAIARKTKQKERQQVLASVPMVPKMVVNAAPDVDIDVEPSSKSLGARASSSAGILGAIRPMPGIRLSTLATKTQEKAQAAAPAKPRQEPKSKSTLDDEYQKFVQQMNDLL
ncbi:hypothetical protein GGI00_000071 [Coemansia sp. RSA 2681]|nr:hypothetical protein GGI00_000071 [Coemansia sp. RSA 2681]